DLGRTFSCERFREPRVASSDKGNDSRMTTSLLPNPIAASPSSLLYAMRRDPLEFFTTLAREHGDIVRFRLGDHEHDLFLVNHPDYIRDVLMTQDRNFTKWFAVDRIKEVLGEGLFVSEGEFHRRQRRLSQPAFHGERIAGYAEQMVSLAVRLREGWTEGAVLDVCREMNWLAMMIVGSTLFGANVESDAEQIRDALDEILEQFERSILPRADREDFEKALGRIDTDRKSTRLNSSHRTISYAVFCLKKKITISER